RNVLFTAAERQTVQRLIGVHAESLAYIFSIGDREAIWDNLEALAELPKRLDVRVFGTDGLMRVSETSLGGCWGLNARILPTKRVLSTVSLRRGCHGYYTGGSTLSPQRSGRPGHPW